MAIAVIVVTETGTTGPATTGTTAIDGTTETSGTSPRAAAGVARQSRRMTVPSAGERTNGDVVPPMKSPGVATSAVATTSDATSGATDRRGAKKMMEREREERSRKE